MDSLQITKQIAKSKKELLSYFRDRANESLDLVRQEIASSEFKEQAQEINRQIFETRNSLLQTLIQQAKKENWNNREILESALMITYTNYIVMIESRNDVWPYEYMAFSRRIGELWEPFCKLAFEYPITDVQFFVPPLFSDVRKALAQEIDTYIDKLKITRQQKKELKKYYEKVWTLVTSGEIKLELDLHFTKDNKNHNIDFKSGFGSNEKGNTNRLLMVATIYNNLEKAYKNIILVRSEEDANNHYFQTLKNSGVWEGYCSTAAYDKIGEFVGYDLRKWIKNNMAWEKDLNNHTYSHLKKNKLQQYLKW